MVKLTISEILKATQGKLLSEYINTTDGKNEGSLGLELEVSDISTDSRKIKEGDLFIPIIGEKFDGHDYIYQSLSNGAVAALSQKATEVPENKVLIIVKDTMSALRELAAYYRAKFNIPIVGVTGSVGKTSTKEMIASVLEQRYKVLKTIGNFNNEIGLPLTIFRLDHSYDVAVIEMGMSGLGEIRRLSMIAKPEIGVITNIGLSHIEKLGSKNNILKAKMEIVDGMKKDGVLILNADDKLLYGVKDIVQLPVEYFGMEEEADFQAFNVMSKGHEGSQFEIEVNNSEYRVSVPVPGLHNIYNALSAILVGLNLGMEMEEIVRGIEQYKPEKMRMNIIDNNGSKIIDDVYNSSPDSVRAALNVLSDLRGSGNTIAVLGDMLEMGEWAKVSHIEIGKYIVEKHIDVLVTVGKNGRYIAEGAREAGMPANKVKCFDRNLDVSYYLTHIIKTGDIVLIKGSRGMKMEEIVEEIRRIKA